MMYGQVQLWVISIMQTMFGLTPGGGGGGGGTTGEAIIVPPGSSANPSIRFEALFGAGTTLGFYNYLNGIGVVLDSSPQFAFDRTTASYNFTMHKDASIGWGSNSIANVDTFLFRDGPGIVAQRNLAFPQAFRVYNSYTDASNGEWFEAAWGGSVCRLTVDKNGTGVYKALQIKVGGNDICQFSQSGDLLWNATNTYSIGSAANRPKNIHVGSQVLAVDGTLPAPAFSFASSPGTGMVFNALGVGELAFAVAGQTRFFLSNAGNYIANGTDGIINSSADGASGLIFATNTALKASLRADSFGVLAQRDGTNQQSYRIYNTYTNAANGEWGYVGFAGNVFTIGVNAVGTGVYRPVVLTGNGVQVVQLNGKGLVVDNATGSWTATNNLNIWNGTAALVTTATIGFLGVNSCPGAPTGVPANVPAGQVALAYDSTNNKLYAYNGAWKAVTMT